jgi:glycogen operon protein
MTDAEWGEDWVRVVGLCLGGNALPEVDENGNQVTDDPFLILLNGHHEPVAFNLPTSSTSDRWEVLFDTASDAGAQQTRQIRAGRRYKVKERSLVLLRGN